MSYHVNEVFYSLQGEGHRKGTANVFVRFAGCNLQCNIDEHGFDCDTDFSKKFVYPTIGELFYAVDKIGWGKCRSVIFTGGEPGLQLDAALVKIFKLHGWFVAVETNGMYELPGGVDWISCSPKRGIPEYALKVGAVDELRFVVDRESTLPDLTLAHDHVFVSPAFDVKTMEPREGAMENAIKICKEGDGVRLSTQDHKYWNVR